MAATISIVISDDVLKALRRGPVRLALASTASPIARRGATQSRRGRKAGRRSASTLREGSLGSQLVAWASGRKGPFGVPAVMKALGVKRSHANMLLTRATRGKTVQREGRGVYRRP